jgi:hypothetical protein
MWSRHRHGWRMTRIPGKDDCRVSDGCSFLRGTHQVRLRSRVAPSGSADRAARGPHLGAEVGLEQAGTPHAPRIAGPAAGEVKGVVVDVWSPA